MYMRNSKATFIKITLKLYSHMYACVRAHVCVCVCALVRAISL